MSTTPNEPGNEPANEPQGNPHIAAALEGIPDEFANMLRPRLEEWDNNSNNKIQSVQAEFEPYQDLIDQGYEPELIQNALALASNLEQDPQGMVKRIADHFQIDPKQVWNELAQGQQDTGDTTDPDLLEGLDGLENHPLVKQLAESQQRIQEQLESQQQGEVNKEAEAALDEYLDWLHTDDKGERIEFDDNYVLSLMASGVDGEKAVDMFFDLGQQYFNSSDGQQQQPTAPVVSGGQGNVGTGLPDPSNPPRSMDRQKTSDLVIQMLQNADQQTG